MKDNRPRREEKAFIRNHPLGAAVTDINIAAALLCCEGVELAEMKDNPGRSHEKVFVLKGDREMLAKRALEFFKSRIDGKQMSIGPDGMKMVALFSAKVRELKSAVKNGLAGSMIGGGNG